MEAVSARWGAAQLRLQMAVFILRDAFAETETLAVIWAVFWQLHPKAVFFWNVMATEQCPGLQAGAVNSASRHESGSR